MKNRGILITFEGGEGAGKTTLIEKISAHFSSLGLSVVKTREPGGTALGEKIRALLLEPSKIPLNPYAELCLFLASRAEHIEKVILPALDQGAVVLCDRFNDSSIAYQGIARGLGKEKVADMCRAISQGVAPNLTFYLDIAPDVGLTRVQSARGKDRIEEEGLSFHQKIRNAYLELQKEDPARMHILNASLSKEEVFVSAMHILERIHV